MGFKPYEKVYNYTGSLDDPVFYIFILSSLNPVWQPIKRRVDPSVWPNEITLPRVLVDLFLINKTITINMSSDAMGRGSDWGTFNILVSSTIHSYCVILMVVRFLKQWIRFLLEHAWNLRLTLLIFVHANEELVVSPTQACKRRLTFAFYQNHHQQAVSKDPFDYLPLKILSVS